LRLLGSKELPPLPTVIVWTAGEELPELRVTLGMDVEVASEVDDGAART